MSDNLQQRGFEEGVDAAIAAVIALDRTGTKLTTHEVVTAIRAVLKRHECGTCLHLERKLHSEPCRSCFSIEGLPRWVPRPSP